MKRNFFKKLSFVLASAMVLTTLAPASGALAAGGPKLNSKSKYLHLGRVEEGQNEFNFNITGKKSGWKYEWTSANENVAEVNAKNGVATATGVGATKVSVVITDKDGEEVEKLTAKVTVRDNIETVKISNLPEGTIGVGEEYDFNRSYVTESGSSKKTSGVTRWVVSPKETATIDAKGVFVATAAGEYTITANSFQSVSKYDAWLADGTDYVTATTSEKVTVAPSMLSVAQIDKVSAKVTFDSDMSKVVTKDNLKVVSLVGADNVRVNQLVKEIKFNAAGTEATVVMYVDFLSEGNYLVIFGEKELGFSAAKIDALEVAKVELAFDTMVYTDAPKELSVKLFNATGVNITTDALLAQVTYELNEDNHGYLVGKDLYLFNKDEQAVVTATFHTYTYNETTFEEIVVKGTGVVRAVDATQYGLGATTEWTFGVGAPDWDNAVKSLAAGDTGYSVFARAKKTDDAGTYVSSTDADSLFTFSSSDSSVLVVDTYGTVYPAKAGNAVIVCYYDGVARDAFNVTVSTERKVGQFSANKLSVNITNSTFVGATDEFELTIKDQLQADWPDANVSFTVESLQGNPTGVSPVDVKAYNGVKTIGVTGSGATDGTWRYLVKGHDKQIMLTVNVQKPTADGLAAVKVWKLSLDKYTVDTAVANKDAVKSVTPELLGYASNGIACYKADLTSAEFSYKVNDVLQVADSYAVNSLDGAISTPAKDVSGPAITAVSGSSIDKIEKGAYVVNAYEGTVLRGTARFTVTDSTPAASYVLENATTTKRDILEAVRDAFKVTFNGDDVADEDLYEVTYVLNGVETTDTSNSLDAPAGNLFVKSVKFMKNYDQTDDGDNLIAVEHTVNIGRTIVIK